MALLAEPQRVQSREHTGDLCVYLSYSQSKLLGLRLVGGRVGEYLRQGGPSG